MENRDPFHKWIKETGTENPGKDFHLRIIQKLENQKSMVPYSPIITAKAWAAILIFIGIIIINVLLFVPGDHSTFMLFEKIPQLNISYFTIKVPSFSFPAIIIDQVMSISIAIFSLFSFLYIFFWSKKWHF
ncbi:hypothetical protein [Algoriphagus sp. CAU 1675]|uniref:hypothetical protein n=1 Tax=Algoriphagus sp. CAU 1675 TaxID=3032597 RepID=UPI0023DB7853|nr:hypothetical protein [Algoriphagus sp. CAU 1675]MDF2157427.1 hypothetical protein [Algoriphagus sp. CAU 1675]